MTPQRPIFSSIEPLSDRPVFASQGEEQVVDPEVARERAQTAALAEVPYAEGDFFSAYQKSFQALEARYRAGQAEAILEQSRLRRMQESASVLPYLAGQGLEPQSTAVLSQFLEQQRQDRAAVDRTASEVSLFLQEIDPSERLIYQRALEQRNFLENRITVDTRLARLQSRIDAKIGSRSDAPLIKQIIDFGLMMLPFTNSISATGNIDAEKVTDGFRQNIISGRAQYNEIAAFWQMSDEEFTDEFIDDTIDRITANSTRLGWRNNFVEASLLADIAQGINPNVESVFDGLDNGPLLLFGASKAVKALGLTGRIVSSGSRSAGTDGLARMMQVLEEGGETTLRRTTGETAESVVDNVLPGSVNPDPAAGVWNVGAEASRRYQIGKQIAEFLNLNRPLLSRLRPDELQDAVSSLEKNIQRDFGKNRIINTRVETRTDTSGIESPVLIVELGTAKGGRFANLNNLTRFLRGQGYDPQYVNKIGEDIPRAPRKPREAAEPEQVEIGYDNPGGAWLEGKRRIAAELRETAEEGSINKTVGPANVTAYTKTNVEIDVDRLNALPGAMGEEATRGTGFKAERLKKSIEEKGYEPSPILVQVREDGQAFIVEGNNRVAEAVASKRGTIPARVEWLRGAEDVAGNFAPDTLITRKPAPKPRVRKRAAKPLPPEKDPVIDIFLRNVNVGDAVSASGYKVNPSKETLDRLVANSRFGEVKILVTKEGNKISLPDGMTHSDAIDELKIPSSDVGRSSYFLKKGETKPLTFKDTPFKTRMEEGVKPESPTTKKRNAAKARLIKAEKDLEEVKQSYALVAGLSGKVRLDTTRNLRQQERALEKEIRKLKDEVADIEATRPANDPIQADIVNTPEGNGWTAEIEFPVVETGFYKPIKDVTANWGVGRFVLGGRQLSSEDLFGLAVMSISRRNSLISTINKQIVPTFRALKSRERKALDSIIKLGEREGKWFSRNEIDVLYNDRFDLTDAVTPERFHEAYAGYRMLNDLEYMLRNDEVFSIKNAQGLQTATISSNTGFELQPSNVRVLRQLPKSLPKGRTYNATDNFHYLEDDLRKYNPQKLQEEGYVFVELDRIVSVPYREGNVYVKNIIVRKSELSVRPLSNAQINYRAGGHRMYSPNVRWFVKQATVLRQADSQETFLGAARTWKGATNKAELADWVERHNHGIRIMRELRDGTRSEDEAREALEGLVDDADSFFNDVEDGVIGLDEFFEAVGDRELPSAYAQGRMPIIEGEDDAVPGFLSSVETQGRMYYSPKGKPLTNVEGEELPTLDAYDTVNTALGSVANLVGLSTYKQRAMGKWIKTYGNYLDVAGRKSFSRQFVEGQFRRDTPTPIVNAAEQQRQTIMRTLNWTTPEQMKAKTLTRNLINYLEEKNTFTTRNASKLINWVDQSDFMSKLRGLVFDSKLGLFNIAQFPMQITTMLAATSIDPRKGMQAMYATPFLRAMNTKYNDMDSFVEALQGRTFGFGSTEEFVDMASELRRSGFLDVNSSQVQINDMNLSTGFNLTGSKITDVRELGRTFFYEAERWNRTTAWQMGWRRAREKYPNVNRQEFLERVFQEAEDLSLNMTEASSAMYQKGIFSIPTQFWAYQNRILEAAFGRQFTPREKMRLILGQAFLYGSAGIPGVALISEYFKGKSGAAPTLKDTPVAFAMDRGFIDTVIQMATGNDLAFSERAGIGHFHTDVVRELFGLGRYGDESTFEVLGGASASIFWDTSQDLMKLFKWMAVEAGAGQPMGPVTRQQATNLFRNISTVNNSLKAYALWKFGILESSSGKTLFAEGTTSDAIAAFLGIPMGEVQDINAKVNWLKNRKKAVEDAAQILIDYRTKFAASYPNTGDIGNELYLFTQVIPPDLLFEALDRANRFTPDPVYESISRNVREKKAELEATK